MKVVCMAIRQADGSTSLRTFQSLHEAQAVIGAERRHLSIMCADPDAINSLVCNDGLIVRACIGDAPNWDIKSLEETPTSNFLSSMPVNVTIETAEGVIIQRNFISQHAACVELEAQHRAFRWIIKGEKYKSTKCKLGRIVKVVEVEPDADLFNEMIRSRRRKKISD